MEIFQNGALPNLEYQFLQVIWCAIAFMSLKVTVTNDTLDFTYWNISEIGIICLFHANIPSWGTSQLGISLISSDLVCFNIN